MPSSVLGTGYTMMKKETKIPSLYGVNTLGKRDRLHKSQITEGIWYVKW